MSAEVSAIDRFVQLWLAEFSRAIEMFSGQAPETRSVRSGIISVPPSESAIWVTQAFTDGDSFLTWVGAQQATWESLGAALGEGNSETLRSTFLEIISQAQQGVASSINASYGKTMRCETAEIMTSSSFHPAEFVIFDIELTGSGLPALCFAIGARAVQVLDLSSAVDVPVEAKLIDRSPASSTLGSLLTLRLPVLVSVGQTRMTLKQVLDTYSGSVIPLSKDLTAPVDLLVHGKIVARGEIVSVKGNYGFRVTQIVSWQDRLAMCRS